jgi:hypothetical protein
MARTATPPKTAAASVSRSPIGRETGKAVAAKAEPKREQHAYNWRSRNNLKQNQDRGC